MILINTSDRRRVLEVKKSRVKVINASRQAGKQTERLLDPIIVILLITFRFEAFVLQFSSISIIVIIFFLS